MGQCDFGRPALIMRLAMPCSIPMTKAMSTSASRHTYRRRAGNRPTHRRCGQRRRIDKKNGGGCIELAIHIGHVHKILGAAALCPDPLPDHLVVPQAVQAVCKGSEIAETGNDGLAARQVLSGVQATYPQRLLSNSRSRSHAGYL